MDEFGLLLCARIGGVGGNLGEAGGRQGWGGWKRSKSDGGLGIANEPTQKEMGKEQLKHIFHLSGASLFLILSCRCA